MNEKDLKHFLENIKKEDVIFKQHFYDKKQDREYLKESEIISLLKETKNILGIQEQIDDYGNKYRVGIKLSNNYNLVIIFRIKDKNLYIITAWKTSGKWQKSIQK